MKEPHMKIRFAIRILTGAALVTLLAIPVSAQEPYAQPDDSWISIDGTVDAVYADRFVLDYGDGSITVEMDDGDRDADAYVLMEGDKVSVAGRIDDDFMEVATIEASSVYVESINTYFYASAVDEEDAFVTITQPVHVGNTVLQGTVTSASDEEFVLSEGGSAIRVEVEEMPYNPLDDEGYQRIEVGDVVSVTGEVDVDLFEGGEFVAESIIELRD